MAHDQGQESEGKGISRRDLLKYGLVAAGGAATGLITGKAEIPTETITAFAGMAERKVPVTEMEVAELYKLALNNLPHSQERVKAELEITKRALQGAGPKSSEEALEVITDSPSRREVSESWLKKREQSREVKHQLATEEIEFAKGMGISQELLKLVTDEYSKALSFLSQEAAKGGVQSFAEKRQDIFKPQLLPPDKLNNLMSSVRSRVDLKPFMPNPGSMVGKILSFSRARIMTPDSKVEKAYPFDNVGDQPVTELIGILAKSSEEKTQKEQILKEICAKMSENSGIAYNWQTLPGIVIDDEIYIGSRPLSQRTLRVFDEMKDRFGIKYNPLNPESDILVGYLSQALGLDGETGWLSADNGGPIWENNQRIDYADNFKRQSGFAPDKYFVHVIKEAGNAYYKSIMVGGVFERIIREYHPPMAETPKIP